MPTTIIPKPSERDSFQKMSETVRVAVLDTGGAPGSRDQFLNLVAGVPDADTDGHGTSCCQIVKAVAPSASVVAVKVLADTQLGDVEHLARGLAWCLENNIDVVNLSLGFIGADPDRQIESLCRRALDAGITVVSVGSLSASRIVPGSCESVLSAAASRDVRDITFQPTRKPQIIGPDRIYKVNIKGRPSGVRGDSFLVAYVSGMIARGKSQGRGVLEILQNWERPGRVDSQIGSVAPTADERDPSWPRRLDAVLFPFSKELQSVVRFCDQSRVEVRRVVDFAGRRWVGTDAGTAVGTAALGLPIEANLDRALCDAELLVLGHPCTTKKDDYIRRHVSSALERNCHVFSLSPVQPDHFPELYERAEEKSLSISYPQLDRLPHTDVESLEVDCPVLAVAGTSSSQGKFTLQLAMRRCLIDARYRVAQIGTEAQSVLLGIERTVPLGVDSPKSLRASALVVYADALARDLNVVASPDMMLVGTQSGTVPYDIYDYATYTMSTLPFLLGTKPDACILAVNSIDPPGYIRDTMDAIRAVAKCKTLALAMSDKEKHIRTAYGRSLVTPRQMTDSEVNGHLKRLEREFKLPTICIAREEGVKRVTEIAIDYFSADNTKGDF